MGVRGHKVDKLRVWNVFLTKFEVCANFRIFAPSSDDFDARKWLFLIRNGELTTCTLPIELLVINCRFGEV